MFKKVLFKVRVWRMTRLLRTAENASLGHAIRVAAAHRVLLMVNR